MDSVPLPPRYKPEAKLGQGGGGEVWAVTDRVTHERLALKLLAADAGEDESLALVREAVALSGLESIGVPKVVAFGTLPRSKRRYLVRELVVGESLDVRLDTPGARWIGPLVRASEQLTALHRAGMLHGDVKPANVIVGADDVATLVDLGLAAPWMHGGSTPRGLTPQYAAPELWRGAPLTPRVEVYALGVTLREALERQGDHVAAPLRAALLPIAARATALDPEGRYPSVDEFASALRRAAQIEATPFPIAASFPVVGVDAAGEALRKLAATTMPGAGVLLVGPSGSGRTTLARRLAWSLGVEGASVAWVSAKDAANGAARAVAAAELATLKDAATNVRTYVVLDDAGLALGPLEGAVRAALGSGAVLLATIDPEADRTRVERWLVGRPTAWEVPPLDLVAALSLVRRAIPSLPDAAARHVLASSERRPARLRAMLERLTGHAIISPDDVDRLMREVAADASLDDDGAAPSSVSPSPLGPRELRLGQAEAELEAGRYDDAARALEALGEARTPDETLRLAIARARIDIGQDEVAQAKARLEAIEAQALLSPHARAFRLTLARAHLRIGDYAAAADLATLLLASTEAGEDDAIAAEGLAVRGLARAMTSDEAKGTEDLTRAIGAARASDAPRAEALALVYSGILHQRAGRTKDAKESYERSLVAGERAREASMIAGSRLNLASLARAEGDLAGELVHLEAAVDLARRAGARAAYGHAVLNLVNLDVYLGRYARAEATLASLGDGEASALAPSSRAMLLGVRAELLARTGAAPAAAERYEASAREWESQGRTLDAAEARLEAMLLRIRDTAQKGLTAAALLDAAAEFRTELELLRRGAEPAGFQEHEALAELVAAEMALIAGDELGARQALDRALGEAAKADRREWEWQALEARARLARSAGHLALAKRDAEAALAILEEIATRLPRDLRDVFWSDPRRRALRSAVSPRVPFVTSGITLGELPGSSTSEPLSRVPRSDAPIARMTTMLGILPAEDRLARIFEITRELATERDLTRLFSRVVDHAVALASAEHGFILLLREDGELDVPMARDRRGDDSHAQFSRSVAEKVLETGEPVVATSARDDERLATAVSVHRLMIQSIACVPIRGAPPASRPIGALYIETRLRPGRRFEAELPTLAAFADQAAIAIENARLLAENVARAEELARANAELAIANDKIAASLDRRTEQLAVARRDLKAVRAELRSHFGYGGLVGTSAAMRRVYAILDRIKDTDVPIIVTGESGTGKEVLAKALHGAGPRAKGPFLGVNCGAIPANLLESELFGHVRGAFTGADRDRAGLFRECSSGTLLLDEVGEMPLKMQAGLLRVLQEGSVRPVGGTKEEKVDTRVVAATHRDLGQMVAEGAFREDLFYRLQVVEIHLPPLRDRKDDIPALVDHFLGIFAVRHRRERKTLSRDALRALGQYDWPGNVRQLEHVLLNAWLMSEAGEVTLDDLELPSPRAPRTSVPPSLGPRGAPGQPEEPRAARNRAEFKDTEKDRILAALAACNWNRLQAAKVVGLPRRTFYRRLKEFKIL